MTSKPSRDIEYMKIALELARRGRGHVEPNPMVGSLVVQDDQIVGRGYHPRFGGPHAEIVALHEAGHQAKGATLYVTLEPCCHQGKTPPCTDAILRAGIARVVIAMEDPFQLVAGKGIDHLLGKGIEVSCGVLKSESTELNAAYLKLIRQHVPYVHAKWAMSLDGKMATRTGDSKWISCDGARRIVHELRGVQDAIIVGIGTVLADDPLLTARPRGPRRAARVVLDSSLRIPLDCQLVRTAKSLPLILATTSQAPTDRRQLLEQAGADCLELQGDNRAEFVSRLLQELGKRQMTHVMVEGGGQVLGSFLDAQAIDEVHVFVGSNLIGGMGPLIAGQGAAKLSDAMRLRSLTCRQLESDILIEGRLG